MGLKGNDKFPLEATSLFQDLKTQKVFSFQNVITTKSHPGTHNIIFCINIDSMGLKGNDKFPLEATSLFQDLKTQKVFSFQNVITTKSHPGTHNIIFCINIDSMGLKGNDKFPLEATSIFLILKTQNVSSFQNVITPKCHPGTQFVLLEK